MRARSPLLEGIVRHRSGLICFVSVALFATICLLAQWLRPDLDWRHAPLSNYLKGHYGGWVRGAYYVLSMALVLLGVGLYAALRPHARRLAPLLLLVVAGVALVVHRDSETDLPFLTTTRKAICTSRGADHVRERDHGHDVAVMALLLRRHVAPVFRPGVPAGRGEFPCAGGLRLPGRNRPRGCGRRP
jgi:hypothetical protein